MLIICHESNPKKEYEELGIQPPVASLCNLECILFCFYDFFLQRKKSTWTILEITFTMLAIITATINNNDSIFYL